MKLHRTTGKPDWVGVANRRYNTWQQMAAATFGIVTPGNVVTLCGLALVLFGLVEIIWQNYWTGLLLLVLGRLADLTDGWLADKTATKSPLGETLDASIDKLGTAVTIIIFGVSGIASWWLLVGLALPNVVIAGIVLFAAYRNRRNHPSRVGKISMALAWVGLLGFVLLSALSAPAASLLTFIVHSIAIISIFLGTWAAAGYARLMRT